MSVRRLATFGAVVAAGLSLGCPTKSSDEAKSPAPGPAQPVQPAAQTPVQPPPPQPSAPPNKVIPPAPAPKDLGEAWKRASDKQMHWRVGLAKGLKTSDGQRALLTPFAPPSPELERLCVIAEAIPYFEAEVGRPVSLRGRVQRLFKAEAFLGATPLKPNGHSALGLLLLADARLLGQTRFVLTSSGWQNPRQGLGNKTYPLERARPLLQGAELARDGRWKEATPLLTKSLIAEAKAMSQASKDEAIQKAWAAVEGQLESSSVDDLKAALARWTLAFTRKDLKGPALLNKKG